MLVDVDKELQAALQNNRHAEIVRLYTQAATTAENADKQDEACFFLTQAWIHSLQFDLPAHSTLHARLAAYGRV